MKHLSASNIRAGLNLGETEKNILKLSTEPSGDERIKNFFLNAIDKRSTEYKELYDSIIKNDGSMIYKDQKSIHSVCEGLKAYEFYSFTGVVIPKTNDIVVTKDTELIFVNHFQLSFEEFCSNFMEAQSFAGNYNKPFFSYNFVGIGKFSINQISTLYPMVLSSRLNLEFFFIFFENLLASVENIIHGELETELSSQKSYLSDHDREYHKSFIEKAKRNSDNVNSL